LSSTHATFPLHSIFISHSDNISVESTNCTIPLMQISPLPGTAIDTDQRNIYLEQGIS